APHMLVAALRAGDPTGLGWVTFALYLLAVLVCFRCALADGSRTPWGWQAASMLALGLNKQLDLQTVLLRLGRQCARATGWFAYRRGVEFGLFLAAVLVLVWATIKWRKQLRAFARENPLVLTGNLLVLSYAAIRALAISHVDTTLGFSLGEPRGLWFLEVG